MKKLLAILLLSLATVVGAQTFPTKPVKIIVCLGAGSGPDAQARRMAEVLTEKWGKPVYVENRPGGGGSIGVEAFLKEPNDGHTIGFFDAGSIVSYPILYNRPDLIADVEPVMPLFTAYMALLVSTEVKNLEELKKLIAKNPTYGSWAVGSAGHLAGAEFGAQFNKDMTHVAYKDYPTWYIDISNRAIPYGFGSIGSSKAMVDAGKIQYLGIAAPKRDPNWPNVPTIKELTGKAVNAPPSWLAFYTHKSLDETTKRQLERDLRDAANDPKVKASLAKLDYIPYGTMSLKEFNQLVQQDIVNYKSIAKKFNISVQ